MAQASAIEPGGGRHGRAVALMVLAAVLWSTAGVVSRHLSPGLLAEGKFELVFWRSLFAALGVAGYLAWTRYDLPGWLRRAGWPGIVSCLCWGGMFTAFMVALAYTSVARVLVVSALGPLMTAVLARLLLRAPLPARTWIAIIAASIGLPCALMVVAARHLTAPEVALLALLEIVLGPIWAWLGAGEVPAGATLAGGALVLAALVGNELAGRRAQLARR